MRSRIIVCPCEDVEAREIEHAVAAGYDRLEKLKRSTGVATGPCQGRWCLGATLALLAELTDTELADHATITHRPPSGPVPLGALAAGPERTHDDREEGDDAV